MRAPGQGAGDQGAGRGDEGDLRREAHPLDLLHGRGRLALLGLAAILGASKNHDFLTGLIVIFTAIIPLDFAKYAISENHTLHS